MKTTLRKSVEAIVLIALLLQAKNAIAQNMPPSVVKLVENGQCTGVVFDRRGYILTAEHCGLTNPKVYFPDGRVLKAERVYEPKKNRVDEPTILRITQAGSFAASNISKSPVQKGDAVTSWGYAVGNPQFNRGKVVRVDQEIHVDFYTIVGNSGGPLFNAMGEIIGLGSKSNKPFENGVPAESHWIPLEAIHQAISKATKNLLPVRDRQKNSATQRPVLYIFGSPT